MKPSSQMTEYSLTNRCCQLYSEHEACISKVIDGSCWYWRGAKTVSVPVTGPQTHTVCFGSIHWYVILNRRLSYRGPWAPRCWNTPLRHCQHAGSLRLGDDAKFLCLCLRSPASPPSPARFRRPALLPRAAAPTPAQAVKSLHPTSPPLPTAPQAHPPPAIARPPLERRTASGILVPTHAIDLPARCVGLVA